MSEREPITAELRRVMNHTTMAGVPLVEIGEFEFARRCDAIDAVHAGLERENAELRERLAILDKRSESMHDGGRITDELREWAKGSTLSSWTAEHLTAIADRIDAEHERQLEVLYRDMSDAEYVKLLKDTGGEYIREHDKVDWRDHAGAWHENATVVALCNDGCYVMDGSVFHVHKSDIRHHRAPTVEDVLTKFGIDWEYEDNCEDRAALLAEYAAKLRLAGSDAE